MGTVISVLISVLTSAFVQDAYAWLPKAADWLFERGLRKLCPEMQERYREEWLADFATLPNSVIKLRWAFGCNLAAERTNAAFYQQRYDDAETLFKDAFVTHTTNLRKMTAIMMSVDERGPQLSVIVGSLEEMRAKSASVADKLAASPKLQISEPILRAQTVLRATAQTVGDYQSSIVNALSIVWKITDARIEQLKVKIDKADRLVQSIDRDRIYIKNLLRSKRENPSVTADELDNLSRDVVRLQSYLDDIDNGYEEDVETTRNYNGIVAALHNSARPVTDNIAAVLTANGFKCERPDTGAGIASPTS
jgi:hypothetical protein